MDHIHLLIEYRNGKPQLESIHAVKVGEGRFRIEYSPGFVQGIAAGDEFSLIGGDGAFNVIKRSGNVAIQIFSDFPISKIANEIENISVKLNGRIDGGIEFGAVLTVPISVGFKSIEAALTELCQKHPGVEWLYGNVYDPCDGVTPLNWWVNA